VAVNYEILASESVEEPVGPTGTREMLQITARAKQSGVAYIVRLPPIISDPESVAVILSAWADEVNDIAAQPGVVSVSWVQDINAQDMYEDKITLVIDSSSGRMQITRDDIPLEWYPARMKEEIAKTRAELDAIEAQ